MTTTEQQQAQQDPSAASAAQNIATPPSTSVAYLHTSIPRFVFLYVLTLGIYIHYWFYKNWSIVQKAEGSNISPFWRGFFNILFCYGLLKRICSAAEAHGYQRTPSPKALAAMFITSNLLCMVLPILAPIGLIFYWISIYKMLQLVKFNNLQVLSDTDMKRPYTRGERTLLLLGGCYWIIVVGYWITKVGYMVGIAYLTKQNGL